KGRDRRNSMRAETRGSLWRGAVHDPLLPARQQRNAPHGRRHGIPTQRPLSARTRGVPSLLHLRFHRPADHRHLRRRQFRAGRTSDIRCQQRERGKRGGAGMIDYAKYLQSNKSDEKYTPRYAVLPIIKYLPRKAVIWCPFDTENSEFVIALKEAGHK